MIVRSSSLAEDMSENSQAGKCESIADVSGEEEFIRAVKTVIGSYDDDNEENQVLVHPMLSKGCICGVAFTMDPNTLGNYYVINYDDSGSTSAITSGQGVRDKLYYRFKLSGVPAGKILPLFKSMYSLKAIGLFSTKIFEEKLEELLGLGRYLPRRNFLQFL